MEKSLSLARYGRKVVLTVNNDYTSPSLVIERNNDVALSNCSFSLEKIALSGADEVYDKPIYSVMGVIQLLAGPYLILITSSQLVGQINGQDIWCIKEGIFSSSS